jgi:Glycosyltransferase like family 2
LSAAARRGLLAAAIPPAALSAYLVGLLAAARAARRRSPPPPPPERELPSFLVLVPAHDEQAAIGAAVKNLRALDYPRECFEVVVIADNCGDRTAALARAAGALVLERDEPALRGKGHALAWALARIEHAGHAVAMVDADCRASANLLRAAAARFASGADCVQCDYRVSNPEAAPAAALRFAGFALVNSVRPQGKSALGLSCGLLGTGMAFRPGLLEELPWAAFSLAEDAEYHLRLVAAGHRAEFCPEAEVVSPMPVSLEDAGSQESRWEGGRGELARTVAPGLLGEGLRSRDPVKAHAALEPALPPLSLLAGGTLVVGGLAAATRTRGATALASAALGAQAAYVTGGLRLARAPAAVWRSLALTPRLAVRKTAIYARSIAGRGPRSWTRTQRDAGTPARVIPAQANSSRVGNA